MVDVGRVQHLLALFSHHFCSSVVDVRGGVVANARMPVLVVIPGEKSSAVGVSVLVAAEAIGKCGPVLEGPECTFGVRVVVTLTG